MRQIAKLAVLFLIGMTCHVSAQEKREEEKAEFIPLAFGNRWEYKESEFNSDGKVTSSRMTFEEVKGIFDTMFGRYFYIDATDYALWVRNTPKGNEDLAVVMDEETGELKVDGKPGVFFQYPVEKGATYRVDYGTEEIPPSDIKVVELTAKVKVPAGEFSCLKYESYHVETDQLENVFFVCPGVGLIKMESYDETEQGQLVMVSELTEYTFKNDVLPKPADPDKSIIPLALGNTWTYQSEEIQADGTKKLLEDGDPGEGIKAVFVNEQGASYYLSGEEFGLWSNSTPRGNEDAIIEINEETLKLELIDKPTVYYQYPVKKGTKYDLFFGQKLDEAFSTMTVAELDVKITVPAGTFSCIKYEMREKSTGMLETVDYVSPGIGLIRNEYYEEGKVAGGSVLAKYKIHKSNQ